MSICRPIPERYSDLLPEQREFFLEFIRTLRKSLYGYFKKGPKDKFLHLEKQQQNKLYILWQQIFFNDFLPLPSQRHEQMPYEDSMNLKNINISTDFIDLMLLSMYYPMDAEKFNINVAELWKEQAIPECCKVILSSWLIHIPYYNLEEIHRQKVLRYAPDLFSLLSWLSSILYFLVNECTKALWRISYVGGNNLAVLAAFGDFIAFHMSQFFINKGIPTFTSRKKKKGRKIRIGYISRLFYGQAVSYYMVNRVIHHDKDQFEVYTFALGNTYDEITTIFEKYSDSFRHFKNIDAIEQVYQIVQDIIDSELDILIYTDIGMDPLTYMLAGLRLAPFNVCWSAMEQQRDCRQ